MSIRGGDVSLIKLCNRYQVVVTRENMWLAGMEPATFGFGSPGEPMCYPLHHSHRDSMASQVKGWIKHHTW